MGITLLNTLFKITTTLISQKPTHIIYLSVSNSDVSDEGHHVKMQFLQ
jgi:hypothetical protein